MSEVQKTVQQQLIEERAGRDIRLVIADLYGETGRIVRVAELIEERYGVPVGFATISAWIEAFRGEFRRTVEFPEFTPTEAPVAEVAR